MTETNGATYKRGNSIRGATKPFVISVNGMKEGFRRGAETADCGTTELRGSGQSFFMTSDGPTECLILDVNYLNRNG